MRVRSNINIPQSLLFELYDRSSSPTKGGNFVVYLSCFAVGKCEGGRLCAWYFVSYSSSGIVFSRYLSYRYRVVILERGNAVE